MPFRFNMLLEEAGIDPAKVRLLRHQPTVGGQSLADIWRNDPSLFELYQAAQATAQRVQFSRAYWAAFIGTWDGRTMFVGLYEVDAPTLIAEDRVAPISGVVDPGGQYDHYPTSLADALKGYAGRLFIDWGGGASGKRAWVQKAETQDKLVTELTLDASDRPFPGLMELTAPLSSLDAAPPTWAQRLKEARGVYLLTCPRDGSLYIGSATGEGGFWQRWSEYRANGHGGNVAMRGRERSDYVASVLEVSGSTATPDDILAAEASWKRKLLTGQFGLTRN
ncbi:GIY-YIG nuclease family protein [Sphingomonas profundi]|uniref:GIY-YIG nuclease family protein n=1 Tax=Alterirhizorhabdus profundi TaxID=2681549 RepID=UPI0012E918EE|nr:GIY-YIG nuclease family protein [Sphingomonas profundi]